MFSNLTNQSFSEDQLNAFKFRIMVLCRWLEASSLIEPNRGYEVFRVMLLSVHEDAVTFMVADVSSGGMPTIGVLSPMQDYLFSYGEVFEYCYTHKTLKTNIAISADRQPFIQRGLLLEVEWRERLAEQHDAISRNKFLHYEDTDPMQIDELHLYDSIDFVMETVLEAVYNFEYLPSFY